MEKKFEKIYIIFYLIPLLYTGFMSLMNKKFYGEAKYATLTIDRVEIVFLLFLNIFAFTLMILFYKKTKGNIPHFKRMPLIRFDNQKMSKIILIILIIQIPFTLITGSGVINNTTNNTGILLTLINILNVKSIFYIYFVICREDGSLTKLMIINTSLYVAFQIIQGWTSCIFDLTIIQLFIMAKYGKFKKYKKLFSSPISLYSIFFIVGSFFYKFMSPLKTYIRDGKILNLSYYSITFFEAIQKLFERFTNFSIVLLAYQNSSKISHLIDQQNVEFSEILAFFRPLVPSFLLTNKNFRTLNNLVLNAVYANLTASTGTGFCSLLYAKILFQNNVLVGLVWLLSFVFLFFVTLSIYYAVDNKNHDANILYLMFLVLVVNNGSLEIVFSYGVIGGIYLIVLIYLFGGFKIYKKRRCI